MHRGSTRTHMHEKRTHMPMRNRWQLLPWQWFRSSCGHIVYALLRFLLMAMGPIVVNTPSFPYRAHVSAISLSPFLLLHSIVYIYTVFGFCWLSLTENMSVNVHRADKGNNFEFVECTLHTPRVTLQYPRIELNGMKHLIDFVMADICEITL